MAANSPSPFTIPTPQWRFVEGPPAAKPDPSTWTLGMLIEKLREFANVYEMFRYDPVARDANVNSLRETFIVVQDIDRIRTLTHLRFDEDLTIESAQKLLGELIRKSNGSIKHDQALKLNLNEVAELLEKRIESTTVEDHRKWGSEFAIESKSEPCPTPNCGQWSGNDLAGWACAHCGVSSPPNPLRREEALLVAWSRFPNVAGKFASGWEEKYRHCKATGMPNAEPNHWLPIIADCWQRLGGKVLTEDDLIAYFYRTRGMFPNAVMSMPLADLAKHLQFDLAQDRAKNARPMEPQSQPHREAERIPENRTPTTVPRWRTIIGPGFAALIVAILAALYLYGTNSTIALIALAATGAFVLVYFIQARFVWRSTHWPKHAIYLCLVAAGISAAIPSIKLVLNASTLVRFEGVLDNSPWAVFAFVPAAVAFGVLQVIRERGHHHME